MVCNHSLQNPPSNGVTLEVWPTRLAGSARMMQDPHLVQYTTGSGVLVMDTLLLKCQGVSANNGNNATIMF